MSERIVDAFYPPYFLPPELITQAEMDSRMDAGLDTFALVIPPNFQRDVLAGRSPAIQLNVDATRMNQGFTGSGYVQTIVSQEVQAFTKRYRSQTIPPVDLALRVRFNPELNKSWFGAVRKVIDMVTMLSIVLTGTALIREREHGTIEHLLVMPVTPLEIMASKVWSMGLVVLVACAFSMVFVVQGIPGGADRRLATVVPVRRHASPIRRHFNGHLPGNNRPLDAAVRPVDDVGSACRCKCSPAE